MITGTYKPTIIQPGKGGTTGYYGTPTIITGSNTFAG